MAPSTKRKQKSNVKATAATTAGEKLLEKEKKAEDKATLMDAVIENRPYHEAFMREAIKMCHLALESDETPVGCVFVHNGKIIARGMNGTNATLNGTRHAEHVALSQIISKYPVTILHECDLYVTVEPCVMCASCLRQFGVRSAYFGCLNDRFGGCGGVMKLHSDPSPDPPFTVYGGVYRAEAILLLRKFYVQENEKAPAPKPKKNRELKTEILPVGVKTTQQVKKAVPQITNGAAEVDKTEVVEAGANDDTANKAESGLAELVAATKELSIIKA